MLLKNIAIALFSLSLTIASVEAYLRLTDDGSRNSNDAAGSIIYHETLGWIPKPDFHGTDPLGNAVTILADGTRSNGGVSPPQGQPILVVGDSFVFGAEVADHQSWPAQLEKISGRKVVNAGVCGYGIDQSVLRAEELIKKVKPSMLIFGIFPGDVSRSNLSKYYRNKPFFALGSSSLELKNVPVPRSSEYSPAFLDKLLSNSYIVAKFFPGYFFEVAHRDEEQVAALLLKMISQETKERNIPIIFMIQYNDINDEIKLQIERITSEVRHDGYSQIVDFYEPLKQIRSTNPNQYLNLFINKDLNGGYWIGHMTPTGNQFIAESMFAYLHANNPPQQPASLPPPQ